MNVAWRIVKQAHASRAFSGEGARRFGGRWNRPGTSAVYLSETLSLAALELFVHLGPAHTHIRFVRFRVEIPDEVDIDEIAVGGLPSSWRSEPPPDETMQLGDRWISHRREALLRAPSVHVPEDHNLLLDPLGPVADRLVIGLPRPFSLDPRLWK